MTDGRRADGTDISALLGVLRRRAILIVAAVVIAGGVGYTFSKRQDPKYESSVNLILRGAAPNTPTATSFGTPTPTTAPDREALVLSGAVKNRVVKELAPKLGGAAAAEQAFNDARALSQTESSAVKITASASTPQNAALIANTIAGQNITERRANALRKIRRAQRVARRELVRLGPAGTTPQKVATAAQLSQQLNTLNQAAGIQDGDADILAPAVAPTSAASPKPTRDGLIGAFAGLLLGLAVALVREQLDRRLKHVGEMGDTFGLPVLANVPTSRALSKSRNDGKALENLPSAEQEAFQMLRANLRFINTGHELRSVVVTSAGVGDGKSTVAINLAKADASAGGKVLLIEADMRRPSIGERLGLGGVTDGLATYLARPDTRLEDVARSVAVSNRTNGTNALTMDVLVAGTVPGNPSELINSQRMIELIGEAEQKYALVVIDTSPAGIVADAIPLMSRASAVVVVGRVGKLTSGEASALREQLERIDAPAYGLVANFSTGPAKNYGYY